MARLERKRARRQASPLESSYYKEAGLAVLSVRRPQEGGIDVKKKVFRG